MIINVSDIDENSYFSDAENDNKLNYLLLDDSKDFLIESLDFMNIIKKEPEIIYPNNNIKEKINLTDKKNSEILTGTNTNISQLIFSYEKIKNLLKENKYFNIYLNKIDEFKENPEIKEIDYEMNILIKKRKEYGKKDDSKNIKSKKNRGRKKAEDETKGNHNKKSPDNIIKKIKGYFIEYLIIFVNKIISKEKINKEKFELKSLNHKKYIDKIKKDEELKLLKMTVKDYLSQDISPKYIKSKADWNKNIINKILNEQKGDEVIEFVFNMSIKYWIELFTLKKSIIDCGNLSVGGCEVIEKKIPSIADLFDEILEKNKDDIYFTKFIFYLYNYENWFESKRGRNKENKI